jgi:Tfp pilus assembly protein PilE
MNRFQSNRTGTTLIEMLTVLTFAAVLISVLSTLMSRVLVANSASEGHLGDLATLGRLGEQFHRDVHAANQFSLDKTGQWQKLHLSLPEGSEVRYEIVPSGVSRVFTRPGESAAREVFVMKDLRALGWNDDSQQSGQLALQVARLRPTPYGEAETGRAFSVVARLAGDRRLATEGAR